MMGHKPTVHALTNRRVHLTCVLRAMITRRIVLPPLLGASLLISSALGAQRESMRGLEVPAGGVVAQSQALAMPRIDTISRRPTTGIRRGCAPGARGKRLAQTAVAAGFVGGNLALYEYFRRAWWSGEKAPFFVNYDWDAQFRDQDKLGHVLGGYQLSEVGREALQFACMSEKKAALWAAAYSAAFQLQIELWDGTQAKYGFSPPDMLFNTIGQGLSLSHTFIPKLRAVTPTFSYRRTQALKNVQAGRIPGDLRPTVDYSGQTYWLAVNVDTLLPRRARAFWPDVVRLSLGHSITDWVDPNTGDFIRAQRRIVLSLDIDPLKLPGSAGWWMTVKHGLRQYHFPSPALEFRSGGVRGVAWYR